MRLLPGRLSLVLMGLVLHLSSTSLAASEPKSTDKIAAPPSDEEVYKGNLATVGITYNVTANTIDLTIDESKAIAALPLLHDAGVVGSVPPDVVKKKSAMIAIDPIGVTFVAAIVSNAYTDSTTLDQVHVQGYFIPAGSKDATAKQPCFSFNFNRALFKTAAWDTLQTKEFIAKVPGFKYSDWCAKAIGAGTG